MTANTTYKKNFFDMRSNFIACLFLTIATLTVYWQAGNHEFINYDDITYVTGNPHLQAGFSPEGIIWAFTSGYAGNWHPLTWISHILDIQLYGMDPGRHHLTNVLFHIGNTLLLFLVFRRMTGALWRSAFIAALFALHPLHVESVAWIAERKDVLSTFFWMLTMGAYVWYVERRGFLRYLLVLLFFILGLMAKPMLVTLPFVFWLLDYWPLSRFQFGHQNGSIVIQRKSVVIRLICEKIPLFALAAASCIVTLFAQQSGGAVCSFSAFPINIRIANALVSYVGYIVKMLWPHQLAVLYPHPGMLPWILVIGSCLLLVFISMLAVMALKRYPWLIVGWVWYIVTLVPVIGLVQVGSQAMADRYTYVPLIGIFIMIAFGVPELLSGWRYRKIGLSTMAVACLLVLMATTWFQVRYWANSVTLFERALAVTENNYVLHSNLGVTLFSKGKVDEAIGHFHDAMRINPRYAKAHNNLGTALIHKGKVKKAITHFREALRIRPGYSDAHDNLQMAISLVEK